MLTTPATLVSLNENIKPVEKHNFFILLIIILLNFQVSPNFLFLKSRISKQFLPT